MAMTPTPHRFYWPAWELGDVFGWVLDRDRALFGRIFTEEDWRSASYIALIYPTNEREPRAPTVLLHALQRGELIARDRDGHRIDLDWWLSKNEIDLRKAARRYLCPREEVLKLWLEDGRPTVPSRLKPFWPKAEAAIMGWLSDNGCPAPRDGGQATIERFAAEWLDQHGGEASVPTIRRHVRDCIKRYRDQLAG
jgi:hypothetical protein